MSTTNVGLRTFSEQHQLQSQLTAPAVQSTGTVDNKTTKDGDTITFAGKQISKKQAVAGGVAILATAAAITLAVIKRKDISSFLQSIKLKNAKPEAIVIPEKGYDLSKEAANVSFNKNRSCSGFAGAAVVDKSGIVNTDPKVAEVSKDAERLDKIHRKGCKLDIGITKDGHAFVEADGTGQVVKHPQYHGTSDQYRLSHIMLISDSKEFTPAQKNLIALIQQNKMGSENSPFGQLVDDTIGENPTRESILDAIAKWAKDIDATDVETQKTLGRLAKLKSRQTIAVKQLAKGELPISYD